MRFGQALFLCLWVPVYAQKTITLQGINKGENLYIQNPASVDLTRFCIDAVYLNEVLVHENPKVSAIEVVLTNLLPGASVSVRILHKGTCRPFLINPKAIEGPIEFRFIGFSEHEHVLEWRAIGMVEEGRFAIQRLLQDEWETLGELEAVLNKEYYRYAPSYDRGYNTFRIRYQDPTQMVLSNSLAVYHKPELITFSPEYVIKDKIVFSQKTYYELQNANHKRILKGETKVLPVKRLPAGEYYLMLNGVLYPLVKR